MTPPPRRLGALSAAIRPEWRFLKLKIWWVTRRRQEGLPWSNGERCAISFDPSVAAVSLQFTDSIVVRSDQMSAAEHANDLSLLPRVDNGDVLDVLSRKLAECCVQVIVGGYREDRLGGQIGRHDKVTNAVSSKHHPQVPKRKDTCELLLMVNDWKIGVF